MNNALAMGSVASGPGDKAQLIEWQPEHQRRARSIVGDDHAPRCSRTQESAPKVRNRMTKLSKTAGLSMNPLARLL